MPSLLPIVAPLIFLILVGYGVGRLYTLDLRSIGALLIFVVTPVVAFGSTAQLVFRAEYLWLPVVGFGLACATGIVAHALGRRVLRDQTLSAFLPEATGTANTGYMGLPIIMALFAPEWVGVYFLILLGMLIFENSVGYYFIARHNLSVRNGLKKVLRLPALYAILAGLIVSACHVLLHPAVLTVWQSAKGAYVFCGMMLVGLALASYKKLEVHRDLLALTVIGRYGLYTLFAGMMIWMDINVFHLFDNNVYRMLLFIGLLPTAANLTAIAAECNYKPHVAAPLVILTSILSFLVLPLVLPVVMAFPW